MKQMTIRDLKIYFKDKSTIFFSLLGVLIIWFLFVFFLGDQMESGFVGVANADEIVSSWVVSGMLAACSVTTSLGAYGVMVEDKTNKCIKDFYSSPLKRSDIAGGYMITGIVVSFIMSCATLILGEIYIVTNGGSLIYGTTLLQVFGVMLLSSFSSSALVCFIVTFVKNVNTFVTISVSLGTLVGFLIGAYIAIGSLPVGIQWVIKLFPPSHSAVIYRQLLMNEPMAEGIGNTPVGTQTLAEIKELLGVTFTYGTYVCEMWVHALVLLLSGLLFYGLAILKMSLKTKN